MSAAAPPHRPCTSLERERLAENAIHRFVLGEDDNPRQLSAQDAASELGDVFAQLVLLEGTFPRTVGEVLSAFEQAVGPDDPLRVHQFFLVGEGGQIPPTPGTRVARNLRFLATIGTGRSGPDVMISAFHPDQGTVELMAWDRRLDGFNYYRTVGASNAWIFAGSCRADALSACRRVTGGPFESHKSGHFVMKELRIPWVNWDSTRARVPPTVFAAEGLGTHPWVERLEPTGAYTLETAVAVPSIQRWTAARLKALLAGDSTEPPRRILEQVADTLTVNLTSSQSSSAAAVAGKVSKLDLPASFFVDAGALDVLGLKLPPPPITDPKLYVNSLRTFGFVLTDGREFSRPGDTHFAFVVPERAFEDTETMRQAIEQGIITRRLAACLIMVDFANPVFSAKRRSLLDHIPDSPITGSAQGFANQVADAILASPDAARPSMAEHEFAQRWGVGEDFDAPFNQLLAAYYGAFGARPKTQNKASTTTSVWPNPGGPA